MPHGTRAPVSPACLAPWPPSPPATHPQPRCQPSFQASSWTQECSRIPQLNPCAAVAAPKTPPPPSPLCCIPSAPHPAHSHGCSSGSGHAPGTVPFVSAWVPGSWVPPFDSPSGRGTRGASRRPSAPVEGTHQILQVVQVPLGDDLLAVAVLLRLMDAADEEEGREQGAAEQGHLSRTERCLVWGRTPETPFLINPSFAALTLLQSSHPTPIPLLPTGNFPFPNTRGSRVALGHPHG